MNMTSILKSRQFIALITFIIIALGALIYLATSSNPKIQQMRCGMINAGPEMAACLADSTCRDMIMCFAECDDPGSELRKKSKEKNMHLQHPDSPVPCTVKCMDDYDCDAADAFLNAFMSADCAADSQMVDTCFNVNAVRPFSKDPAAFNMSWLVGKWESIATGGWDHWDCQKKIFFSHEETGKSRPWHSTFWATYRTYPKNRGGKPKDNYVYEEIYINKNETGGPTWRTKFKMWGTESEEEWHVFAFSRGDKKTGEPAWIIAEVCILTPNIKHTDVFTIVLSKRKTVSEELRGKIERIVKEKIGYPLKWVNNTNCTENPNYEKKQ